MTAFQVRYHHLVIEKDIPNLDPAILVIIKKSIESKLSVHPHIYGKQLQQNLKGLWSHRVGDWRVIFRLEGQEIRIVHIGHRRDVYRHLASRLDD